MLGGDEWMRRIYIYFVMPFAASRNMEKWTLMDVHVQKYHPHNVTSWLLVFLWFQAEYRTQLWLIWHFGLWKVELYFPVVYYYRCFSFENFRCIPTQIRCSGSMSSNTSLQRIKENSMFSRIFQSISIGNSSTTKKLA